MFLFMILCISLGGVFGEDICEVITPYEKCVHHIPKEQLNEITAVPNKEELMAICPGELSYFECFHDHLDDCGRGNEHYTVITFLQNSYEIAKDLCDEESQLHKDYVYSAECYKTLEGIGYTCEDEAKDIYQAYYDFLREENPERLEHVERSSQRMCMIQSYKMACISEKVQKTCGEVATNTFLDLVSRSQYLRQFCSQSFVDELQTTFLNRLNLEDENREIYANAFNLIKK